MTRHEHEDQETAARVTRRAALGVAGAGALAGLQLAVPGVASAATGDAAATSPGTGAAESVRGSFKVTDKRGRQRFLLTSRKPPIIFDGGKVFPARDRQGPDRASYLIFNDDNGDERGGITAGVEGAGLTLDYDTDQGISLGTYTDGERSTAALSLSARPETFGKSAEQRVHLAGGNSGAVLQLKDSHGRSRIVLRVDEHDRPTIEILDAKGTVVSRLPS